MTMQLLQLVESLLSGMLRRVVLCCLLAHSIYLSVDLLELVLTTLLPTKSVGVQLISGNRGVFFLFSFEELEEVLCPI